MLPEIAAQWASALKYRGVEYGFALAGGIVLPTSGGAGVARLIDRSVRRNA